MTKLVLPESLDSLLPDEIDAEFTYVMGHNCGQYGPNQVNSHFRLFATPELTAAWERGKADAEVGK